MITTRAFFTALLAVVLLFTAPASGQYYYHDILGAQTTADQIKMYRQAKIRKVTLRSYEADGTTTNGFVCVQDITPSFNQIKTFSQTTPSQQSVVVSQFNFKGQLIRSTDSNNTAYKSTIFSYADDGRLSRVEISSGSYASKERERELHNWYYEGTFPHRMLLVRRATDTTEIRFLPDENGKVAEEEWWKKGNRIEKFYYYYDAAGRLTDIVRFHEKARRLLPDQIFAYNESGQLAEWIAVNTVNGDYTTWRYTYNNKALREKDACYNKKKQLVGWILYHYE